MSKKVYHIVDPETGEVVGKKRLGKIGQGYYKTPPRGRALYVLLTIGIGCIPLTFILLILASIFSDSMMSFWGIATMVSAAICVIGLLFGDAPNDDENSESTNDTEGYLS